MLDRWQFQYEADPQVFVDQLFDCLQERKVQVLPAVGMPKICSNQSKPYISKVAVTIEFEEGSTVYYTDTRGGQPEQIPSCSSKKYKAQEQIEFPVGTYTLQAFATKAGHPDSEVRTHSLTVLDRVSAPDLLPPTDGPFNESVRVEMACSTPGARIWFTRDGQAPSEDEHEIYKEGGFELRCAGKI